jgi:hypothetical protein
MNISPKLTERAVFIGKTGCGKTTLARYMLNHWPFVVVLDIKDRLFWKGYKRVTSFQELINSKEPKLIYAPKHEELIDKESGELSAYIHDFFKWIYNRQNTVVYIDEVYGVTIGNKLPYYYHACLTRGRELNIMVFSATQRPKDIPQVILSESDNYYVFRLLLPQDRAKVKSILPFSEERLMALGEHQFLYGRADGIMSETPLRLNL